MAKSVFGSIFGSPDMSDCMAINANGILIYKGDQATYEIVGGKNGQINLSRLS